MSEALRRVTMFQGLDQSDLDTLAGVAREVTAERGEIIVSQGSKGESLYVVVSGQIRVYLSDESGKEIILGLEGPGCRGCLKGECPGTPVLITTSKVSKLEDT